MEASPKKIGRRIREARLNKKISQEKLASFISNFGDGSTVCRAAISQWENGVTKYITAGNLLKAALALDVSPYWLQFGIE
jgi:transcriptional regulator with XRE-family HTH domain